jgi:hypothetical protein
MTNTPKPSPSSPTLDDRELEDLSRSAFETAMGCGVSLHSFTQLAETVRRRALADLDAMKALSVTRILLDVVPGEDGMGQEVYACSVADAEAVLAKMAERIEELELAAHSWRLDAERYRAFRAGASAVDRVFRDAVDFQFEDASEVTPELFDAAIDAGRAAVAAVAAAREGDAA